MEIVVGISGASGSILAIKLLENLSKTKTAEIRAIVSKDAENIMKYETGYGVEYVRDLVDRLYPNDDLSADIASGTHKFDAMVIVPCSMSTVAKIACGIADNLITRTAAVALKERRKLILVPRETPLSTIALKRLYELSSAGAIILPPMPAFYLKQSTLEEVAEYIAGKILDQLGIEHRLYRPYAP